MVFNTKNEIEYWKFIKNLKWSIIYNYKKDQFINYVRIYSAYMRRIDDTSKKIINGIKLNSLMSIFSLPIILIKIDNE